MTENEAKQWLKHTRAYQYKCDNCEYIDINGACNEECKDFYDMAIQALEEIQQYRAIGTVEECKSAVERMKPKKVEIKPWSPARCPACGYALSESHGDGYYSHPTFLGRCPIEDCGQKLDWE